MQRQGMLIAAAFVLVLALVAANMFSNRGTPAPSETAPENITVPRGNPPPLTTAPDAAPGRTLSPSEQNSTRP
ncbi:MAG: hypothetical protein J0I31_23195 [Rhizobiales bacterium]|uniref:hypothetical protein n=1 Tax=Xanthobacter TaxID=279 RepID=UPI00145F7E7A|nr:MULTISPECIES: hypothetical protein [Xanthobacter]MBN8918505.1 hypothetical protein [Hyphomicrobiales bacterium]NMN56917.1 hypothetical protein [Xanthobacter sp. SG618]UDQ89332.1 hypothetical protein LJE71_24570 [Xanthobacter autotrophicus]